MNLTTSHLLHESASYFANIYMQYFTYRVPNSCEKAELVGINDVRGPGNITPYEHKPRSSVLFYIVIPINFVAEKEKENKMMYVTCSS